MRYSLLRNEFELLRFESNMNPTILVHPQDAFILDISLHLMLILSRNLQSLMKFEFNHRMANKMLTDLEPSLNAASHISNECNEVTAADYDMALHVGSLFSVLILSFIGTMLPIIASSVVKTEVRLLKLQLCASIQTNEP